MDGSPAEKPVDIYTMYIYTFNLAWSEKGVRVPPSIPTKRRQAMSVKYAILGLLHYRDMHGYRIKRHIEQHFGHMWSINYGQIYPNLKRLEEEGLGSDVRVSQLFNEELRSHGKPAPMTSQSMRGDNR